MSENRFYWIAVHHWLYGDEEKFFSYDRNGKEALDVYMWDKVHAGWKVTRLEVRNRRE